MRSSKPLLPRPPGEPRLLDAKELSVFLNVHHGSIYRWVEEETITPPAYVRINRTLRFDRIQVLLQLQRKYPDKFPGL